MRITVKNFGPIREAKDVHISPLTLFVGPSNTGKTYLAMALQAAIEAANVPYFLTAAAMNRLKISDTEAKKHIAKWRELVQDEWKKKIIYYLGEEGENIVKSRNMSATISSDDGTIVIDLCRLKNNHIDPVRLKSMVANAKKRSSYSPHAAKPTAHPKLSGWVSFGLIGEVSSLLCGNLEKEIYCLPAVRSGIMKSYRLITDQSLRSVAEFDVRSENASPMISGVFSDCARQLIGISKNGRSGKEIIAINKILESNILRGRINVIFHDIGLPEFRYAMKGKKSDMAINNVSASVAELAPLSVFMQYCLSRNDFFILEEPETGLHPLAQQDVADIMVRLVNAGVFVLATTHSDVVLAQIGNAYRASQFKDAGKGRRLLGGDHKPLDKRKELAVYSFAESSQGTKVEKIDFGHITGAMTEDHLDAARSLYNKTVRLVNGKNNE